MDFFRFLQANLALSTSTYIFFICFYILAYYAFFEGIFDGNAIINIVSTLVFYQLLLYVLEHMAKVFLKGAILQLGLY